MCASWHQLAPKEGREKETAHSEINLSLSPQSDKSLLLRSQSVAQRAEPIPESSRNSRRVYFGGEETAVGDLPIILRLLA